MFLNIASLSTKSKKRLYIALHLKPIDMKYNVVKVLNFPNGNKAIQVKRNLEYLDAIQELEYQNEMQKTDMFQDVSNVNYGLDLPSFVCVKNGMSIVYQVEMNHFETMADMFRPSILKHQLN